MDSVDDTLTRVDKNTQTHHYYDVLKEIHNHVKSLPVLMAIIDLAEATSRPHITLGEIAATMRTHKRPWDHFYVTSEGKLTSIEDELTSYDFGGKENPVYVRLAQSKRYGKTWCYDIISGQKGFVDTTQACASEVGFYLRQLPSEHITQMTPEKLAQKCNYLVSDFLDGLKHS